MKIIHVAQFLGIGGLEKIIFHLAKEQIKAGHVVEIYIYDYERSWVSYFREQGLNVITPELKKPGYDLSLLLRMKNDLKDADIIHSHDLNPMMYLGPIQIFRNHPKLIHTTHGLDHILNYPRAKLYENIVMRLCQHLVGVSEKIGNFYKEELKINPKKVSVIPNGIATFSESITNELRKKNRDWLCSKHQLDTNRPIILSLSRIVPLKDQKFLIECFNERPNYQLVIVGPASDAQYELELKKMAKQNITFAGPQELVSEYNLASDLYVSASTTEGIPVAVLEAMAVATPTLVSDIPGHVTLNQYNNVVNTYAIGNHVEFLEKLDLIISNKEKYMDLAMASKEIVEKHFSTTAMVKAYMEVYKKS
jgi:glycosyltransferase involved in cell wall biosynthesis